MKRSFIAVCAGAPLLALVVGIPTAWAAPDTDSGNASVSISRDGRTIVQKGNSTTDTNIVGNSSGNFAVAVNGGTAEARGGTDNRAIAIGDGSLSQAGAGDNNRATAINGARAGAGGGNNNTATAIGDGTEADAGGTVFVDSSNNKATANCGGSVFANGGAHAKDVGSGCQ